MITDLDCHLFRHGTPSGPDGAATAFKSFVNFSEVTGVDPKMDGDAGEVADQDDWTPPEVVAERVGSLDLPQQSNARC